MINTRMQRSTRASPAVRLILGGLLSLALSLLLLAGTAGAQPAPTRLWGYVMSYTGQFVSGATVTLYTLPAHAATGATATSDADGAWSLTSGLGTFAVRATAPGYDFSEQTVYATSTQTGITFILRELGAPSAAPPVATMSGRVTSMDGVPLGGMNVVAYDQIDTGVRQVREPPALGTAITGVDGTYTLGVPAGRILLTLKSGSIWGYQLKPLQVNAGDTITGADFVAAVRILDRSNFPAATPVPPISNAGPLLGVGSEPGSGQPPTGMPATGQPLPGSLWLVLALLGLTAVGAGAGLARHPVGTRRPQRG